MYLAVQGDAAAPQVMLLCGSDLLESFAAPGIWRHDHVASICNDFGVVCLARPGTAVDELLAPEVGSHVYTRPQ